MSLGTTGTLGGSTGGGGTAVAGSNPLAFASLMTAVATALGTLPTSSALGSDARWTVRTGAALSGGIPAQNEVVSSSAGALVAAPSSENRSVVGGVPLLRDGFQLGGGWSGGVGCRI